MNYLAIVALLCATQVSQIMAWGGQTHLMTAQRAYDILKTKNPAALSKAEEVLRKYSDADTQQKEQDYIFVEGVTWPDDCKRHGGAWQSSWHFDDQPIFGDDTPKSELNVEHTLKNITTVMPQLYNWLKGNPDTSSLAYTTVMKNVKSEDEGLSVALRLLIHFQGDVHQPLHIGNRYTKEHTAGDRGGNDFITKSHNKAKELHAVWDSVIFQNHVNPKRPFTSVSMRTFKNQTDSFFSGITVDAKDYESVDFSKFRDESAAIAQHVYEGLTEGKDQAVPQNYIDKYHPIAVQRVAMAAARIAYMIEQIYGAPKAPVWTKEDFPPLGTPSFLQ